MCREVQLILGNPGKSSGCSASNSLVWARFDYRRKEEHVNSDSPRPDRDRSREELLIAEATAKSFLQDHSIQIADTLRAKLRFLDLLVQRVALPHAAFEDRLDYFARISEIAQLIEEDANGFFELASSPMVARIVATVDELEG
jgi:hypothetical protein